MNRGGGAAGCVGLQAFAHQHDEHRLGRGQILADHQRGDHCDADGQVGGDFFFEQRGDRIEKNPVAGEYSKDSRRVDAEDGAEVAGEIQQQQDADEGCEAEVTNALGTLRVHQTSLAAGSTRRLAMVSGFEAVVV